MLRPGRSAAPLALALTASLAMLAALEGAGCGHASRFDGTTYRDKGVAFRVPEAPVGWRQIDVSHANLAFRDEANDASILLNGRCGAKDEDTPLSALTSHLIIGTTERDFVKQDVVPFDGREAMHTVLRAKLDGVVMQYDIFVLKKDGCVYDFVYVASPSRFAAGSPVFEKFVGDIHTAAGSGGT